MGNLTGTLRRASYSLTAGATGAATATNSSEGVQDPGAFYNYLQIEFDTLGAAGAGNIVVTDKRGNILSAGTSRTNVDGTTYVVLSTASDATAETEPGVLALGPLQVAIDSWDAGDIILVQIAYKDS